MCFWFRSVRDHLMLYIMWMGAKKQSAATDCLATLYEAKTKVQQDTIVVLTYRLSDHPDGYSDSLHI